MPESLQSGDKGSIAENDIENLESVIFSLEETINQLDEAVRSAESATE